MDWSHHVVPHITPVAIGKPCATFVFVSRVYTVILESTYHDLASYINDDNRASIVWSSAQLQNWDTPLNNVPAYFAFFILNEASYVPENIFNDIKNSIVSVCTYLSSIPYPSKGMRMLLYLHESDDSEKTEGFHGLSMCPSLEAKYRDE